MKFHDFRSTLVILTQRIRGRYIRSVQKGQLTLGKVLRTSGALLVFLLVLFVNPGDNISPRTAVLEGETQGMQDQASISAFSSLSPPGPSLLPDSRPAPAVTARSVVIVDADSSAIIYEKESHLTLPPASLTKIMTALVVLENYGLDELVTVPQYCLGLEGNNMGLKAGEVLTVEDLLYGLLLYSSSDAACSLASHNGLGGTLFVRKMNETAVRLGLTDSVFVNPIGLDEESHLSSAYDIALLSLEAMKNQVFREIVKVSHVVLQPRSGYSHQLVNTNQLLTSGFFGVTGIKTGYTEAAGGCLSLSVRRGGHEILVVVMGSEGVESRFEEGRDLVEWTFATHVWP